MDERIRALAVCLGARRLGSLVLTPGDWIAFSFDPAWRARSDPEVLSLSFRAATGGLRRDPRPMQGRLPPFFANLLPEDRLREAMERHHAGVIRPGNDFDLLAVLGADLPGAVRVRPEDGPAPTALPPLRPAKARFSLAGVQMKLSVMKNTGKGGGLTLPLGDESGEWIAKFPSLTFPGVAENEFACLALAEAIGMDVPARELVSRDQFEGIPEEFDTLAEGKVLLLRRYDRSRGGQRIHAEDFAQVFGLPPGRKYDGAASHDIARTLTVAISPRAGLEFIRRLALVAMIGNGDMHLKNWSLLYPGAGTQPALAPVYDMLSTVPWLPADDLALSLGGVRAFRALERSRWKLLAHRAHLPEPAVLAALDQTVEQVLALWPELPERALIPETVLARIDRHVALMAGVLRG